MRGFAQPPSQEWDLAHTTDPAAQRRLQAAQQALTSPQIEDPYNSASLGNILASQGKAQMDASGWGEWFDRLNAAAPGGITTPAHRGDPLPGLPDAPEPETPQMRLIRAAATLGRTRPTLDQARQSGAQALREGF